MESWQNRPLWIKDENGQLIRVGVLVLGSEEESGAWPGPDMSDDRVALKMEMALYALRLIRPEGVRSERNRQLAICITELEGAYARFKTFVEGKTDEG